MTGAYRRRPRRAVAATAAAAVVLVTAGCLLAVRTLTAQPSRPSRPASAARRRAGTRQSPRAAATATPAPGMSAAPATSAAGAPVCTSAAEPRLAARLSQQIRAAVADRDSGIGIDVTDTRLGLTCALHADWHFDAASAIKVTILSALLRQIGGPAQLTSAQEQLAEQMITQSSDSAATALWNEVGMTGMQDFLTAAGMTSTQLDVAWGLTKLTAANEDILLRLLASPGAVLSTASRQYVLRLMAQVVSDQDWGVSAGAQAGVIVHLKNGWLPYPGDDWHVNSIGDFTGDDTSYQIVVLTNDSDSMAYGIATIERVASAVNTSLATPDR